MFTSNRAFWNIGATMLSKTNPPPCIQRKPSAGHICEAIERCIPAKWLRIIQLEYICGLF